MSVSSEAEQLLTEGLCELGVPATAEALERILTFTQAVLSSNERTNLIGPANLRTLIVRHVLDSVAPVAGRQLENPVIDLGSGAGFPGIPLAAINGNWRFILLEPRRKRLEFLSWIKELLGLGNVRCLPWTASGAVRQGMAATAGAVLARALAKPEEALHLAMPLVKPGGVLLLYEGRASIASREFRTAVKKWGAQLSIDPIRVPFLDAQRHLWT
ncbi:MAG: 16S rRNA (guanine(527)-N(7))-methyltransferase RsmG, partial [Candidatus Eremiobacteraeota bacterium]|nr:16S rRNA (guanine(527)-N(7))-methyltransferase RsmG [Candidatus Eremiobacteraeota bacterium]